MNSLLAILIPFPHRTAHHAAMHLVAAEVVKSNPLPSPAVCDAETEAIRAEMA